MRSQLTPMTGRDPDEAGRAGSSLEILYDLVFVVAFAVAGVQLADYVIEGHYLAAIAGYLLMMFATIWAWINFAWFSSGFDTDDWFYRILALVQMIGVGIVAIGIPDAFASINAHQHVDLTVVVIGYIVMRVGMVTQWLRVAVQSAEYRATALAYAIATLVAQLGWVGLIFLPTTLWETLAVVVVLVAVECTGPFIAETRVRPTPWNAEHIAERYGTLMVITLGEGVVGTVAVLQAEIGREGWTAETAVLGLAAMGVTFMMWWLYFLLPNGEVLGGRRDKSFGFGYASMPLYMGCAAVGAGLHVVALWIEREAHIGPVTVVLALAVPLAIYCLGLLMMQGYLVGHQAGLWPMALGATAPLVAGVLMAVAGLPVLLCVVVTCLAPLVPVVVAEARTD